MKGDDIGDRMKHYEGLANPPLLPRLPVLARLDGRGFHVATKFCARPFSAPFHELMVSVATRLVLESCADLAFTQSDEITLAWLSNPFFDGNVQKMVSTLAALATARFNREPKDRQCGVRWYPEPTFDCRVWAVPSVVEASNVFLWRQLDATRNSVQMAAQAKFSHNSLQGLDSKQLQEKLFAEVGVNWNDYPPWAKRGTFVRHTKTTRAFTPEEIEKLPPMHDARRNPDLVVERRVLERADADLRTMDLDARIGFLFEGA